jgi:hypothetical protein
MSTLLLILKCPLVSLCVNQMTGDGLDIRLTCFIRRLRTGLSTSLILLESLKIGAKESFEFSSMHKKSDTSWITYLLVFLP